MASGTPLWMCCDKSFQNNPDNFDLFIFTLCVSRRLVTLSNKINNTIYNELYWLPNVFFVPIFNLNVMQNKIFKVLPKKGFF